MQCGAYILIIFSFLTWIGLFHVNAIICYKCDSVTLEDCAMSLNETELPYENCPTSLRCIMSIVDSVTYRGCANTPTTQATYTKSCTENLCNKGVFPPGRMKCFHCSGSDCAMKPVGKPNPCHDHHEIDECFTEIINETEVYRGCKSDKNHTITGDTIYCDINGCNNEPAAIKLRCAKCDSQTDRGCKINLFEVNSSNCTIPVYGACEVYSLLTKKETCFTYHSLNRMKRGCSNDISPDMIDELIEKCDYSDFCNAKCLKQQKCLICDSTINESCRSNVTAISIGTCGSAEASSCYTCESNDFQVRRGCGTAILDDNISRCYECDSEGGCNSAALTRCYKCSSEINPNCANWERPGGIEIEECLKPNSSCIITTLESGVTVRGCESAELFCNTTAISCTSCEGSFCNKGSYPPNRLQCFQCENDHTGYCSNPNRDPLPCAKDILGGIDACFQYMEETSKMVIRGCRSDSQKYYRCIMNRNNCELCHENGCNNTPFEQLLKSEKLIT